MCTAAYRRSLQVSMHNPSCSKTKLHRPNNVRPYFHFSNCTSEISSSSYSFLSYYSSSVILTSPCGRNLSLILFTNLSGVSLKYSTFSCLYCSSVASKKQHLNRRTAHHNSSEKNFSPKVQILHLDSNRRVTNSFPTDTSNSSDKILKTNYCLSALNLTHLFSPYKLIIFDKDGTLTHCDKCFGPWIESVANKLKEENWIKNVEECLEKSMLYDRKRQSFAKNSVMIRETPENVNKALAEESWRQIKSYNTSSTYIVTHVKQQQIINSEILKRL